MKFTRTLIFWQSIVLIFSGCFCSPHPNSMLWPERRPLSESRPSTTTEASVSENVDTLACELEKMGTDYTISIKLMESILTSMKEKWQNIDRKSKALSKIGHLTDGQSCSNDEDHDSELEKIDKRELKSLADGIWEKLDNFNWKNPDKEIPELKSQMAGLLFLLKIRRCKNSTETFYKDRCHPIGKDVHCPPDSHMVLHDGPNNKGFCDCSDNISGKNGLLPIFSNETGKCYFQNTQGPCRSGEWFVIKNKVPQCETVPNKCFVDGTYVYGKRSEKGISRSRSRNNFSTELKCWEINSSVHCPSSGQILTAEHNSDGELQVHCSVPVSEIVSQMSRAHSYPCRMGTRRSFSGECTTKIAIG
ncbi:uncharacterized protein LOC124315415 [Daphnia pulicaria]|uniref:uncharacterized protein LOC124315415 n=1 Tax=Daphnia pulicaria TaxID=35523 RepID=UPI001EEA88BC|nr:uncharacterized protein LOC124315415 [Daphnia pulicaria]